MLAFSARPARWRFTLLFLAPACLATALSAQQSEPNPFQDDDVRMPAAAPPSSSPPSPAPATLPEIPETTVTGRPSPFPSTPLSDDVVLTPSRTETRAREVGSSMTVITQAQIRATGQTSVLEVLRGTVGVDVVRSGGPGQITSVFMRGGNSAHTKVLLDGMSLNDPSGAARAFDFSFLNVDNIERIEVLRGPQSMAYGSDAIGGVINIITKRGQGPMTFKATGQGGSYGTRNGSVGVSGGTEQTYYSFSASYYDTDGFSQLARRFGGVERDEYQNATFAGRAGWTPCEAVNLDYVFRQIDTDTDIDGFFFDDPLRALRQKQFFNRLQLQSLLLDGLIDQKIGFNLVDYNRFDTNAGFFGTPEFNGQRRQLDWQLNLLATQWNVFSVGADYWQEDASSTALAERSMYNRGLFLQDSISLFNFSFTTIGVRWDDHSTAGPAQTYRFTQRFRSDNLGASVHGSIGRGFRAPAIAEVFDPLFGNPNLRPEFSKGWDVGAEKSFDCLTVDVTYFRNDFSDLIFFDPALANPMMPFGALNNIQDARSTGIEVMGTVQVTPTMTLNGTYTLTNTLDLINDRPLVRRPRNKASANLQQRLCCDRATVGVYWLYVGERLDFDDVGNITTLDAYQTVNVAGRYQVSSQWELFGRIDNLFNEHYEEIFGFNTPRTSAFAGATWTH